ncbi:MAG: hypothetical protein ACOC2W_04870 [bacterium]
MPENKQIEGRFPIGTDIDEMIEFLSKFDFKYLNIIFNRQLNNYLMDEFEERLKDMDLDYPVGVISSYVPLDYIATVRFKLVRYSDMPISYRMIRHFKEYEGEKDAKKHTT